MFVMELRREQPVTASSDHHDLHQLYSIILLTYLNTNTKVAYKQYIQKYIEVCKGIFNEHKQTYISESCVIRSVWKARGCGSFRLRPNGEGQHVT